MTKRKDGRWQEVIIINGKTKYFYGKTKAEVLKKVSAYKTEDEKGKPFAVVADEWWEHHEPTLAYNSVRNYKPAYERAREHFAKVPIKEVLPSQIASFVDGFAKTHAQKTVDTQLIVFRLIFSYAVVNGYTMFNAAKDIEIKASVPKKKRHMPSKEDISKIKTSADCTFGTYPLWAMYTGMRKGELLALTWDKVDLENRRIYIDSSVYHKSNAPKIKSTKTEYSIGSVPILDALLPYIKPRKSGLVFPNKNGELLKESQFRDLYEAYQKESGVTCTSHQLRHAYAVMLYEANVAPENAQILLRHANISTTMDIYTEIREEKRRKVFDSVLSIDIVSE